MVRPGYKQTEVGIIPNDWEQIYLSKYAILKARIGWQGLTTKEYKESGKFYLVTGTDFISGRVNWETCHFVDKWRYTQDRNIQLKEGDVLLTKDGTIGKVGYVDHLPGPTTLNSGVFVIRSIDNVLNSLFLYYILISRIFDAFLEKLQAGSTISHLYQKDFVHFKFAVPNLNEQRAIAAALSEVDALITALDKLIAKKRAIKTAAMQQLLTGKKRLPGFSGKWKTRSIGECFNFLLTGSNSRSDLTNNDSIGYIHYGDIHTKWTLVLDCDRELLPTIAEDKIKGLPFLKDGDLIIADASEDYAGIGISIEIKNIGQKRIVAGLHTLLLRAKTGLFADGFKAYITSLSKVRFDLQRIATGISVYGISKNSLKNIDIKLPPTAEQRAIAGVLSDMDEEIAALVSRRDKTRAIKQGMMQELLTGKTRLL